MIVKNIKLNYIIIIKTMFKGFYLLKDVLIGSAAKIIKQIFKAHTTKYNIINNVYTVITTGV
jgi:hypothetical protein